MSIQARAVQAAVARSRDAAQAKIAEQKQLDDQVALAATLAEQAEAQEDAKYAKRAELDDVFARFDDQAAADLVFEVDPELLVEADDEGSTPLHVAASHSLIESITALLKRGESEVKAATFAKLTEPDCLGRTPLHRAAAVDGTGDLCKLLADRCDCHARDFEGHTALQVAQLWGMTGAAKVLLEAVDPTLKPPPVAEQPPEESAEPESDKKGRKKSPSAKKGKRSSVADADPLVGRSSAECMADALAGKFDTPEPEEPVEAGRIKTDENYGYMAGLNAMTEHRYDDALELAQDMEWRFVNQPDARGRTMLHLAALRGQEELITALLLRSDFNGINAVDKDWLTALHVAAGNRSLECVHALLANDAYDAVNNQDMDGRTALHLAALRSEAEIYAAILAHPECRAGLPDLKGRSAPEYAATRGLEAEIAVTFPEGAYGDMADVRALAPGGTFGDIDL